jgi:hypothetical protein
MPAQMFPAAFAPIDYLALEQVQAQPEQVQVLVLVLVLVQV